MYNALQGVRQAVRALRRQDLRQEPYEVVPHVRISGGGRVTGIPIATLSPPSVHDLSLIVISLQSPFPPLVGIVPL